jgi:hypothetical protein
MTQPSGPHSPPRRPGGGGSPQRQSPKATGLSSLILRFALRAGLLGPAFSNCLVDSAASGGRGRAASRAGPQPPLAEAHCRQFCECETQMARSGKRAVEVIA